MLHLAYTQRRIDQEVDDLRGKASELPVLQERLISVLDQPAKADRSLAARERTDHVLHTVANLASWSVRDDDAIVVGMREDHRTERLSRRELDALFDRLFPHGFAGSDIIAEVAPEGWEQSPLLACFHPSADRLFEEQLRMHRNLESLTRHVRNRQSDAETRAPLTAPTLDEVRRDYQPQPIRQDEEVTDLVGSCLWDVFSDNHDVIGVDGRVADIGSFRGASAFLDEYLTRDRHQRWSGGDHLRFYMGTAWIAGRADLTPVYDMIFRKLRAIGADWVYHFPEIRLVDFSALRTDDAHPTSYSVSEGAAAELNAQKEKAQLERLRADLAASNARAREEAMEHPPPAIVCAYRQVYEHDPRGWPPV